MRSKQFDATTARNILIFFIVIMIGTIGGGFYFAQDWLRAYAVEVNKTTAELESRNNTTSNDQPPTELSGLQPVAIKADTVVAPIGTYQNILTQDINRYASSTGIRITNISPSQLPDGSTATVIAGLQVKYLKITLEDPVSYDGLIKFIKAIETNLPKMKLMGISLSHNNSDGSNISVDPLIVEVYTK